VLGIDEKAFATLDLHFHVPAGAVPKDGPSAGITLAAALVSLLTGRQVAKRLAMTGELTLRGAVTAIGGLRNKLVAAKRAGVTTVVLPAQNRSDVAEVPPRVLEGMELVYVEDLDDVLRAAGLLEAPPRPAGERSRAGAVSGSARASARARRP
jgi:ATP-dependent Lon protease